MKCPFCGCKTRVEETASDGVRTYRRRVCTRCYKISGTTEEFTDTKATEAALYRIKWRQKKERQERDGRDMQGADE